MSVPSRWLKAVLVGVTLLLLVTACAKGDSDVETVSTSPIAPTISEPGTTGPAEPPTTEPPATEALGTEIVYAGLEITFQDVSYTPDSADAGTVSVSVAATNPTAQNGAVPTMLLQVGSEELTGYATDSSVLAAETKDTTIEFTNIPPSWSAADSVLLVGEADENQAEVPLDGSDPTFVEPTEPEKVTGKAEIPENFSAELRSVSLRGDFGLTPQQAPKGKVVVVIDMQVATTYQYGFAISGDSFRLIPAGGTSTSAEASGFGDGQECCVALETNAPVDGSLSFAVPEPGTGDYELVLMGGAKTAEIPFSVTG